MKENQPASRKDIDGKPARRQGRARAVDPTEVVFRGHYDLAEFITRYKIAPMEAREIFIRLGPARSGLDQYMRERMRLSE